MDARWQTESLCCVVAANSEVSCMLCCHSNKNQVCVEKEFRSSHVNQKLRAYCERALPFALVSSAYLVVVDSQSQDS